MYASFPADFKPLDPTLHELLSRVLLDLRRYDEAIEETDRALSLLDGDIDLLHRKALALVSSGDGKTAQEIIQRILDEHPELKANPELSSLLGRIFRERWEVTKEPGDLRQAFDAYHRAYEADRTQYYPGINAGSLALALGETVQAERIFHDVLETCAKLQRHPVVSFWVDFTAGEATLGLGNIASATVQYRQGLHRNPPPAARDRESALRGMRRMAGMKRFPPEATADLERLLAPGP
jgi:tetratricopeptide (TPR) repeat protein